jgi:hypothetical protein
MTIQKAIDIIKRATKSYDIYEVVYMARVQKLPTILQAYKTLTQNFSKYEIDNGLYR